MKKEYKNKNMHVSYVHGILAASFFAILSTNILAGQAEIPKQGIDLAGERGFRAGQDF